MLGYLLCYKSPKVYLSKSQRVSKFPKPTCDFLSILIGEVPNQFISIFLISDLEILTSAFRKLNISWILKENIDFVKRGIEKIDIWCEKIQEYEQKQEISFL